MNLMKANKAIAAYMANDMKGMQCGFEELAHKLFQSPMIIGCYMSKEMLNEWGLNVFDVQEMVVEYEVEMNDVCELDLLSAEVVVDAFTKMLGAEILNGLYVQDIPTYADLEDEHMDDLIEQMTKNFDL